MILIKKTILFSLLVSLLVGQALGDEAAKRRGLDPETFDIIMKIKQREKTLTTFSARFNQIQKSSLFDKVVKSSGVIVYDAKGKLLFRVTRPDPLVIVFDGEWVLVHDPEQKKTQKRKIGQRENLLKKYFGVGQPLEELTRRFDMTAKTNAPLDGVTLKMRPKKGRLAKRIRLVSAVVDDTTWLPMEIFIQQSEDDWSRLFLTFTSINEPLPVGSFSLDSAAEPTPPSGKDGQ